MSDIENKVTIGERYTRSTESSDLSVTDRRGDADLLIAAGWLDDSLGALLFRLRTEYDCAHGDRVLAALEQRRLERLAQVEEKAKEEGSEERAAQYRKEASATMLTAHALILVHLKSLRETVQALGRWSEIKATQHRFTGDGTDLRKLAGQVLDVWLDPLCRRCHGVRFTGGSHRGEPRIPCRLCRETGRREDSFGRNDSERYFGLVLLREMERLLAVAASGIRRGLQDDEVVDGDVVQAVRQDLAARRLASVEGETD